MSDSDSDFRFAVGFILGMMMGLAVALVLAPRSGDEVRKLVREKVAKVRDIADDIGGLAREIAGDRKKIYAETWKQPKVKPYAQEL